MFRAYALDLEKIEPLIKNESSLSIYDDVKTSKIIETLEDILSAKKEFLKADDLRNLFFPSAECPVFLSHSGQNKQNVRKFAQWLKKNFEINAFIDSDLWGCIADLQRKIDAKYSKGDNGKYDYEKRNYSTAHVHMMLSHALTQMIDYSECFIFLKSSESISIQDTQKGTFSPWIFHELATVDTIRENRNRKSLPKDLMKHESFSKAIGGTENEIKIFYPVPCNLLISLSKRDLENWQSNFMNPYSDRLKRIMKYAGTLCEDNGDEITIAKTKWEKALNWLYKNYQKREVRYETSNLL